MLVLDFISYSFAFNIGRSITKFIAQYRAVNDSNKVNEVVSIALIINFLVCLISVLSMTILADWFVSNVLQVETDLHDQAVKAIYIASLIVTVTVMNQMFNAVIQAFQRFDIYSVIIIISNCVSILGSILIVFLGYKTETLLVWNFISTLVTTLYYFYYSRLLIPDFKFVVRPEKEIIYEVVKFNFAFILMQIFSNFLVLFERSWLTRVYGVENLTYYLIPMKLSTLVHIFISSFIIVIFPFASELNALGNKEQLLSIYHKATKIVLTVSTFLCLTMIAGREIILENWVGENFAEKCSTVLIFQTITFGIVAVGTVFWQITEGHGYTQITAAISFIWLIISAPLMIIFGWYFSFESFAVARLIGALVFIPALFYMENKIFGKINKNFWGKMIFILILAASFSYLGEYGIIKLFTDLKINLIIYPLVGSIIFLTILLACNFFEVEEKRLFRELLKRFFRLQANKTRT